MYFCVQARNTNVLAYKLIDSLVIHLNDGPGVCLLVFKVESLCKEIEYARRNHTKLEALKYIISMLVFPSSAVTQITLA